MKKAEDDWGLQITGDFFGLSGKSNDEWKRSFEMRFENQRLRAWLVASVILNVVLFICLLIFEIVDHL